LPGTKALNYLALSSATKKKSFITLIPGGNVIKLFLVFDDVEDSHASREYVHGKACQHQMG
jgi:hypothetical protein